MPTMKPPFKSLSPRYRRLLVVPALLAVFLAAVITTTNDFEGGSTVSVLPGGATADPTGPPTGGPGGDGGFNGGQFQPPGMPSHQGGYNGGSYPQPGAIRLRRGHQLTVRAGTPIQPGIPIPTAVLPTAPAAGTRHPAAGL